MPFLDEALTKLRELGSWSEARRPLTDGLIEKVDNHRDEVVVNGQPIVEIYRLTEAGRTFVDRWQTAQPLDG